VTPGKKVATLVGIAAVVAALASAGAGTARTTPDRVSLNGVPAAGSQTVSAAARHQLSVLRHADFSTRAGAFRYLRSRGWDPKSFVIERGSQNYAGPSCPGRGWTCTTARRVLQIGTSSTATCTATPIGTVSNVSEGTCTIVQSGGGTATCTESRTANPGSENCSITQTSTTADNVATVSQTVTHTIGGANGTQLATQVATVLQTNGSGNNSSNVTQGVSQAIGRGAKLPDSLDNDADDFTPPSATPISQSQESHQSLSLVQSSDTGNNASTVSQSLSQRERADNAPSITQLQNTQNVANSCPVLVALIDDPFANQCSTVQQTSTSGQNSSQVGETYNQFQAASNTAAGQQAQGSLVNVANGGLDHRFSQSSAGLSTQSSNQTEIQAQRRLNTGTMTAVQHGPTRKGGGSQVGNTGDTASQTQRSEQNSTGAVPPVDTNIIADHCASDGNCTGNQSVNSNGQTASNSASGPVLGLFVACGTDPLNPSAPSGPIRLFADVTGCTSGRL
jgi:hypothetical protein